jgi:hypothetical protein
MRSFSDDIPRLTDGIDRLVESRTPTAPEMGSQRMMVSIDSNSRGLARAILEALNVEVRDFDGNLVASALAGGAMAR